LTRERESEREDVCVGAFTACLQQRNDVHVCGTYETSYHGVICVCGPLEIHILYTIKKRIEKEIR